MGKDSPIQWTHHTFNPWRGCTKVSAGCAHCYAEELSKRNPKTLGIWGDNGTRVVASDAYWREPEKWNREAEQAGERRRVFCASLADVFEDWEVLMQTSNGNPWYGGYMDVARKRLFRLIDETPALDWLLLTKRPENVGRLLNIIRRRLPGNVWLGTTVENQEQADLRIPWLIRTEASVRFLSMEPLLEAVDLTRIFNGVGETYNALTAEVSRYQGKTVFRASDTDPIDWVIVGGESGSKARPFHVNWARMIKSDCDQAGVAFFLKQLGSYPIDHDVEVQTDRRVPLEDSHGGDPAEWPEDLRVRQFPSLEKTHASS